MADMDNNNMQDPTSPWAADAITLHNLWSELLAAGLPDYHSLYLTGVFLRAMVAAGKPS